MANFIGAKSFPLTSCKEPACQCRRHKRLGFSPWVGKIPWKRAWQPTPVFLPGESHGQRSLVGYSPIESPKVIHDWSDKHTHTHTHTHRINNSVAKILYAHIISSDYISELEFLWSSVKEDEIFKIKFVANTSIFTEIIKPIETLDSVFKYLSYTVNTRYYAFLFIFHFTVITYYIPFIIHLQFKREDCCHQFDWSYRDKSLFTNWLLFKFHWEYREIKIMEFLILYGRNLLC